jgi:MutS domain V
MDPQREYSSRRERWTARERLAQQQFIRIGNARLAVGLIAALMLWLVFARDLFSIFWLLIPLALFIALVVWHQRVLRERDLAGRAIRYYTRGLARLGDEWAGTASEFGERFRQPEHVYSEDLDLFGKGSLFELLSAARTAAGEDVLAAWFLGPASRETALSRQDAVKELREALDLREAVSLLGDEVRAGVDAKSLGTWGSLPPVKFPAVLQWLAPGLVIAGVLALAAFLMDLIPLWPLLLVVLGDFVVIFATRQQVAAITGAVETPGHDLNILALLLERLEREHFQSPLLRQSLAFLPVSQRVRHLKRWVELLDSSDHILMRVIGPLLLWRLQVAMRIEAWRQKTGSGVGGWIRAVGEFEALSSIAALAFERPEWSFPELADGTPALFEASALRHPLLPHLKCVPNDVKLNAGARLLIVSGSNMSGKSTLLRSIGLNCALAWAGAPVAAERLRVAPLRMGASIRTTDSLQDNRSRFLAEILRIRQIVGLAQRGRMVLFLLDELLSGTNSHDRLIGAAGIVRGLLAGNSIGLLTTHDLALTQIESGENVHFEDSIQDGEMEFDYKLRPGVVTHGNALALMRAVGLEV